MTLSRANNSISPTRSDEDLARITRLVTEKVSSASNYSLADNENKQEEIQEEYQKAVDREKSEKMEAEQLKAQYQKRVGEV